MFPPGFMVGGLERQMDANRVLMFIEAPVNRIIIVVAAHLSIVDILPAGSMREPSGQDINPVALTALPGMPILEKYNS